MCMYRPIFNTVPAGLTFLKSCLFPLLPLRVLNNFQAFYVFSSNCRFIFQSESEHCLVPTFRVHQLHDDIIYLTFSNIGEEHYLVPFMPPSKIGIEKWQKSTFGIQIPKAFDIPGLML